MIRLRSLVGAITALLLGTGLAACGPGPTSSPRSVQSLPPSLAALSTPSPPSPTPTPELTHYSSAELSFDYPASWRLISTGVDHHYPWWGPVLGTGHWAAGCATIPPINGSGAGEFCLAPAWWAAPGEVVVVFRGSVAFVSPTPPPDALPLHDGIRATDTEYSTTSVWQVYMPQVTMADGGIVTAGTFTILADYGAPNVEVARGQVRDLIDSLRLSTPPPPASTGSSASPSVANNLGRSGLPPPDPM